MGVTEAAPVLWIARKMRVEKVPGAGDSGNVRSGIPGRSQQQSGKLIYQNRHAAQSAPFSFSQRLSAFLPLF